MQFAVSNGLETEGLREGATLEQGPEAGDCGFPAEGTASAKHGGLLKKEEEGPRGLERNEQGEETGREHRCIYISPLSDDLDFLSSLRTESRNLAPAPGFLPAKGFCVSSSPDGWGQGGGFTLQPSRQLILSVLQDVAIGNISLTFPGRSGLLPCFPAHSPPLDSPWNPLTFLPRAFPWCLPPDLIFAHVKTGSRLCTTKRYPLGVGHPSFS